MNFLDLLIVIPLLYAAYKGFKHGFIIELFTLLAVVVGIYVGINFSDFTASWIKKTFDWNSEYLPVIAFTVTFLLVGAMIYFGGKVLEKVVKVAQLSPLNKIAGVVFALIKMVYIISIFLVLIETYNEKNNFFSKQTQNESLLYEPTKNIALKTIPSLKSSLIFRENNWKNEQDSTGLSVEQIIRAKEVADSLGIDANDAAQILKVHKQYIAN